MISFLYKILELLNKAYDWIQRKHLIKGLASIGQNIKIGTNVIISGKECISIGDNVLLGKQVEIHAWTQTQYAPKVLIGNDVVITKDSYISCGKRIEIGDGCLLGVNTFITDNFHGENKIEELAIPPNQRIIKVKGEVKIGKNVWIGRNVCIMPGVTIGDYSVIGANSVVTKNIPSKAVAVGAPAKVVRIIDDSSIIERTKEQ